MNDQAFHERVTFVRAEAKRIGRGPDAIKIALGAAIALALIGYVASQWRRFR